VLCLRGVDAEEPHPLAAFADSDVDGVTVDDPLDDGVGFEGEPCRHGAVRLGGGTQWCTRGDNDQ
jgi:hypothetical protein